MGIFKGDYILLNGFDARGGDDRSFEITTHISDDISRLLDSFSHVNIPRFREKFWQ